MPPEERETTPSAPESPDERAIYRTYDRQRRLNLVRGIAPVFGLILLGFVVMINLVTLNIITSSDFFDHQRVVHTLIVADPLLLLCVAAFGVGTLAAQRSHVDFATLITVTASVVAVNTLDIMWSFGLSGIDFVAIGILASLNLAIIIAGVLGERWMILVAMLSVNGITVLTLLAATPAHPAFEVDTSIAELFHAQFFLIFSGHLLLQWAIAAVMFTTQGNYNQIMRELGDVRIAYERARQLEELKNQFISNVNHELRTPIMALQGYVELLRLANATLTTEKRQTLLDRAAHTSDLLVNLVNDILSARQLDIRESDMQMEPVAVRELIHAAIDAIDPRESQVMPRDLRLALVPDLWIWGDRLRLQEIILNLLTNAIKYSPPGSPIDISAYAYRLPSNTSLPVTHHVKTDPSLVEIRVKDYGQGIPPSDQSLLFQKFVRLPRDLASTTPGNGLGLYLCKQFAEAMSGSISLSSSGVPGEGTTFIVRLPTPASLAAH